MKAVFQRITDHDPINGQVGDCFRAAMASILELELCEVPHFAELCKPDFEPDCFWGAVGAWLELKGLALWFSDPVPAADLRSTGLAGRHHFVFGRCRHRGGVIGHALVGLDGMVVHDPDHTKPELVNGPEAFGFLISRHAPVLGKRPARPVKLSN